MPHERERAGRTYFSEFTAPSPSRSAFLSVGRIQRAKSNEHLPRSCKSKQTKSSLLSPDLYFQLQPTKAKSTQDLRKDDRKSAKFAASQIYVAVEEPDASLRLEFEQELEEELQKLLKRSCDTVTVPSSVKFSVTGDLPNKQPQLAFTSPSHSSSKSSAMSRPRSPKSKDPQQLEGLEKLLHNIRQQLNQLSDERTQMEQRMDDVVNGIQQAQTQYHNQLRNYYQGRKRGQKHSPPTPNSLRRVHSSGEKYTHSAWSIPPSSDTSLDAPDGPPSNPAVIFSESSQCSLEDYNMKESTVDSAYGGSCSTRGRRSDSFSSVESRSRSSSLNIGGSLSQSNDVFGNWMSNSTIPELPESPRPSAASQPCNSSLSQDSFMQSMPSLSYHSYTTPNRHGRPASPLSMSQRSYSTSTPKNIAVKVPSSPKMMRLKPPLKATSSPDVSRKGGPAKSDQHRHQLKTHRSYHNSLPDSVMNSVIVEDKVDGQSFTDSLSQISICTDDGSPKPTGSTIIIRRSSLTGQLEHIRKPRVATVKRNSSFDVSKDYSTQPGAARPRAVSVYAGMHNQTLPKEFKVLNKGVRRRRTSRPIILNTSVETTV